MDKMATTNALSNKPSTNNLECDIETFSPKIGCTDQKLKAFI